MVVEERKQGESLSRNQMQGKLMVCIYQYLFYLNLEQKPDISSIIESTFEQPVAECDKFARSVIVNSIKNAQEAVDTITPLLNKWKFERLGLVEQAILIQAYTEIKYCNMPKPVVIDVAVKLCLKYANEDSYKFINAVLQNVE